MVFLLFDSGCSGGNPRFGAPESNDGGARLPFLRAPFMEWMSAGDGVALGDPQRYGAPGSDDGDAWSRSFPVGHRFWSSHWLEVVLRWSGVSLPASTMVGLGGMVPCKLGRGCMLCCMR
jgi:hypothetical protein